MACSFIILTTTAKSASRSRPNGLFCYMILLSEFFFFFLALSPLAQSRSPWSNSPESLMNTHTNVPGAGAGIIGSSLGSGASPCPIYFHGTSCGPLLFLLGYSSRASANLVLPGTDSETLSVSMDNGSMFTPRPHPSLWQPSISLLRCGFIY